MSAKGKGKEPEMKVRHKGIDWVGVDKSALTSHCPYVEKMGWFATADSCKGAKELVQLITQQRIEVRRRSEAERLSVCRAFELCCV